MATTKREIMAELYSLANGLESEAARYRKESGEMALRKADGIAYAASELRNLIDKIDT